MKLPLFLILPFAVFTVSTAPAQNVIARLEKASDAELQVLISRYPAADANGDGTLSREEAIAYARTALVGAGKNPGGKEGQGKAGKAGGAQPSVADFAYGPHPRNVFDFWQAEGEGPRPLVVFIHGGGFTGSDKSKWRDSGEIARLVKNGVSCAAINYRFRKDAPIQEILLDAARAVQTLRARAEEWNLDKDRFAGFGGSAGAGTSLWLLSRDDLADPASDDPVARESTRLQAAVLLSTQATYDLTKWESFLGPADPSWWTSPDEAAQFYHFDLHEDLAKPEAGPVLRECDMLSWIGPGDGPVYVSNPLPDAASVNRGHYLHHPAHAREIQRACEAVGVTCVWVEGSGSARDLPADSVEFLLEALKVGS